MSVRDDLRAAARNLLMTLASVPDGKLIYSGEKGPRPALPYVSVRVIAPGGGNAFGTAVSLDGLNAGTPTESMQQRRRATISIQGYGSGSVDWLDTMMILIESAASTTQQQVDGISASVLTPTSDNSQQLDTQEEPRYLLELVFMYQYRSDPVDQVELLTAEVSTTLERYDGDPDTLDASVTITL